MTDINKSKVSVADTPVKKTLGQQLYETHDEHKKLGYVETGDLVNSFGKTYMEELRNIIDKNIHLRYKYYIQVISKHLPYASHRGQTWHFFIRHTAPKMQYAQDLWSITNSKSDLCLEWSLPHLYEMKNFMRAPELYDPKIIHDIKAYLKENKIDLSKIEGIAI